MTNPHVVTPTEIDIRQSADRVIAHFRRGDADEGFTLLQRLRETEREVVQEGLDRYVAAAVLRDGGPLSAEVRGRNADSAARLDRALGPPRIPDFSHAPTEPNEFVGLTETQKFHVYASMVDVRGNEAARVDLQRNNHTVLLGLRRETSTLASHGGGRNGTGVYDDQIVVLGRTEGGSEHVYVAGRASTEPTAQYSHHAGSDGNRPFSGSEQRERRVIDAAGGYEGVQWRKIEGEDVNADTMWDLGRLAEGTIEMFRAEHPNPRIAGGRDAFRPSPEQMLRPAGMVERDTNADGYFTAADPLGVQPLNGSFKIHSGSRYNTDSAGCQTIHPADYRAFIDAAQSNPRQTRWQYVLTSTQGGLFHNVEVGGDRAQPAAPPEAPPVERPADRQGSATQPSGPFENPDLNRYYEAVIAGDKAMANRIALGFAFRAPEPAMQSANDHTRLAPSNEGQMASLQREAPGLHI